MSGDAAEVWVRDYCVLALRVDRALAASTGGRVLMYTGPDPWRQAVESAEPVAPGRLIEDCDRIGAGIPFTGARAEYARSQLAAMRTFCRRLAGERIAFDEFVHLSLGIDPAPVPESVFDDAHARLDAALPPGAGTLAERLHAWQHRHSLPGNDTQLLTHLAGLAIRDSLERTRAMVELPDVQVEVVLDPGTHRGHYAGAGKATIYLGTSLPFNLADLLYVVAHEGFPGHIAESMLIEDAITRRRHLEQQVRFMVSPSFVVSEGLGLHAPGIAYPGDQAQAWLTEHVLTPLGIEPDDSDFAAIHRARNDLWGAWGNAALRAAAGEPPDALKDYLSRTALLTDAETTWAVGSLTTTDAGTTNGSAVLSSYLLAYHHGWRLIDSWLNHPDRHTRFLRLLTEPLLPADLADKPADDGETGRQCPARRP